MRVLGFDTETTGLDHAKDWVVEYGWGLWDTDDRAILETGGGFVSLPRGAELSAEIKAITGITSAMLDEFGAPSAEVLARLATIIHERRVDRIVAHNAAFDRAFLLAELDRCIRGQWSDVIREARWIDTMTDLPLPEGMTVAAPGGGSLKLLCADHGFLNPFPHRALFDALSCVRVLSHYDIADVIARADSPSLVFQALVTFDTNHLAKSLRCRWEPDTKRWTKAVKECDALAFSARADALGVKLRQVTA